MKSAREEVVFADIEGEASAAPLGIDLPTMIHHDEAVVVRRNLGECAHKGLVEMAETADERVCRRLAVCFDTLNLDVGVEPTEPKESA